MNKGNIVVGGLLFVTLFGGGLLLGAQTVIGDEDHFKRGENERSEHGRNEKHEERGSSGPKSEMGAVTNATYLKECGGCHFAFQPGWLPASSWQQMMRGLDHHFGENAELNEQTAAQITDYLVANAADHVQGGYAHAMVTSIQRGSNPLRITDSRFFHHEHDELPARMVKDNPKVGSLSRCDACHPKAASGDFNEHGVTIPGFGKKDH
ncbi:MAG: diheme cytochrome c [Magnetococcales bacterium]|nr:diheme cytochrome c [Magnetococcales bacterium]MBF0148434.1 diheme cytochrome c [Magnetococcales bacterium]MBF0173059.1 diheme cytochrome c [Magnetococcales bacterium]MBF0346316.1 diheme cytochrome c [Magnetococcales bacterium]MBF0631710.1 diheme cytochrome c [Magnetococcales bacterium]